MDTIETRTIGKLSDHQKKTLVMLSDGIARRINEQTSTILHGLGLVFHNTNALGYYRSTKIRNFGSAVAKSL